MRRLYLILIPLGIIAILAVFSGGNRTAADDQTIDFRMNQIMVKLNQIEWELSRVRNRQGVQNKRLDEIDTQLDRILSELQNLTSSVPASSSSATDPVLVGTWRLSRSDFAEEIPDNMRRYLEEQAEQAEESWRQSYRTKSNRQAYRESHRRV